MCLPALALSRQVVLPFEPASRQASQTGVPDRDSFGEPVVLRAPISEREVWIQFGLLFFLLLAGGGTTIGLIICAVRRKREAGAVLKREIAMSELMEQLAALNTQNRVYAKKHSVAMRDTKYKCTKCGFQPGVRSSDRAARADSQSGESSADPRRGDRLSNQTIDSSEKSVTGETPS